MSLTLAQYDKAWNDRLQAVSCPPVLGLAPLSDEDCIAVSLLIDATQPAVPHAMRSVTPLIRLLRAHGSILSVWLARKAGAAYDGNFWQRFEGEIGVSVATAERRHFANEFRRASARSMVNFTVLDERGPWKYAGEFLFQAGLPLHHCAAFADLMRQCERRFGLPDPDDPGAAEQLRDDLLVCLGSVMQQVLRRALVGPAGPAICLAALRVVLADDFTSINPQLGRELARAFINTDTGDGRPPLVRAARPAFLRLGEDLCTLEIVGPRQDPATLLPSGLQWVVNGVAERVPGYEEFVYPLWTTDPMEVEVRGLRAGTRSAARSFVLRFDQTEEPFLLFDAETRRQLTLGVGSSLTRSLRGGSYYLLHQATAALDPTVERLDWVDGERAVSMLTIRPGVSIRLGDGGYCFQADRHPFLEPEGSAVITDDGQRIYYSWTTLPTVWVPTESLARESGQEPPWTLRVRVGGAERFHALVPDDSNAAVEGMSLCRVATAACQELLASVPAGLWALETTLFFAKRPQLSRVFDYWRGLVKAEAGESFTLAGFPVNLTKTLCRGYDLKPGCIRRLSEGGRVGVLVFARPDGQEARYQWSRAGIFLESFDRLPGVAIQPQPHALGERFSASTQSRRELRVWLLPGTTSEIRVNGNIYLRRPAGVVSRHLDLGLANLAALYPQGGSISLGDRTLLATFARPLTLSDVSLSGTGASPELTLTLGFNEPPAWVRPRLVCLTAEERSPFLVEPQSLTGDDAVPEDEPRVFALPDVPVLTWMALPEGRKSKITVPNEGWPAGIWRLEWEVRRDEQGEWQTVASADGCPAPVFLVGDADETELAGWPARGRLIWRWGSAVRRRGPLPDLQAFATDSVGLFDLLQEIAAWTRAGTVPALRGVSEWIGHLQTDLETEAGKLLRSPGSDGAAKLLHLACQEDAAGPTTAVNGNGPHRPSLFVRLPGLLALPADAYRQGPTDTTLASSLRWCADLGRRGRVIDSFAENSRLLDMGTFMLFRNCARFVPNAVPEPSAIEDLTNFDASNFWHQMSRAWNSQQQADAAAVPWSWDNPLGKEHFVWAVARLGERYDNTTASLGQVNALLNAAPRFLAWLNQQPALGLVGSHSFRPVEVWPQLNDPRNFIQHCPCFASVFALAARLAAADRLPFGDVVGWLGQQGAGDQVIATLVGLGPELFGFFLMYWELQIKTGC